MMLTILKFLCRVSALLHGRKFRYSHESEGNSEFMGFSEKLWWGYKYFYRQVERAEKGKHIEEYFAEQELDFKTPEGFAEKESISLAAGGDILASHHVRPDNTVHLWDDVGDFFFNADIVCANLETPVVPSVTPSFVPKNILAAPALNNTPEIFERFHMGGRGIGFFSTANNHCLDMGEAGLVETLDFLDSKDCPHAGTSRSLTEREDTPVIVRNGVKIVFLSYTFSLNGKRIPEGKDYLVNYIRLNKPGCDISEIERDVRRAKTEKGADFVVACLHWSLEFESFPIRNVIDMGHRLMDLGIDVIIGNHSHVVQPMERYRFTDPHTGLEKEGLIVYALGDLISCHERIYNSRLSNLVKLRIAKGHLKGADTAIITGLRIKPVYIYSRMTDGTCEDFRLLDFVRVLAELERGENRFGLDRAAVDELRRLETLMNKVLHKEIME